MSVESIPSYAKESREQGRLKMPQKAKDFVKGALPPSVVNTIRGMLHPGVDFRSKPACMECAGLHAEIDVTNWSDHYVVHGDHGEGEMLERVIESLRNKEGTGVFWDIGAAAQGVYSVFAGQVARNIVCVEPNAYNISPLLANIERNSIDACKRDILSVALGDVAGQRTMYFDKQSPLDTSLARTKYNLQESNVVNVCTIDGLIEDGYPIPTDIKMDVEGAEGLVLKGASDLLGSNSRPHDLFIEFHPEFLPLFNSTYEIEYGRVISNGYLLAHHICRNGQVLCHFVADG